MKDRLDNILLKRNLVKSKSQANHLIKSGFFEINGEILLKPGKKINENADIKKLKKSDYVSRGAYKLKKAIQEFNLKIEGKTILDVGASTGGFTEVLINNGAQKVIAVDVGTMQLAERLLQNPRVESIENMDIRDFYTSEKIDLVVIDLSFISLKKVLKHIREITDSKIIALFKPQFESESSNLTKTGILKEEHLENCINEMRKWLTDEGFTLNSFTKSPIQGKKGNVEFLMEVL